MAYKRRSIVLNSRGVDRIYTSFADWQAKQKLDERTPAERGISIGSSVMWRYMRNNVIFTDRATVLTITGNTLTLQIKDVNSRTDSAEVHEIVSNNEERLALSSHERDRGAATPQAPVDPATLIDAVS